MVLILCAGMMFLSACSGREKQQPAPITRAFPGVRPVPGLYPKTCPKFDVPSTTVEVTDQLTKHVVGDVTITVQPGAISPQDSPAFYRISQGRALPNSGVEKPAGVHIEAVDGAPILFLAPVVIRISYLDCRNVFRGRPAHAVRADPVENWYIDVGGNNWWSESYVEFITYSLSDYILAAP